MLERRIQIHQRQTDSELATDFSARLTALSEMAVNKIVTDGVVRTAFPHLIEISLIGDEDISRVHAQFMDSPEPTDVITFCYGSDAEILVSIDTARRQAEEFGLQLEWEIALYIVHGMLHLAGYEDKTASGRDKMNALQEEILAEVLPAGQSGNLRPK